MLDIPRLLLFVLPAYIANSTPVVFGGHTPIDFGLTLADGKRVFGSSKTWRGLFSGILFGILTAIILAILTQPTLQAIQGATLVGVLLSVGTHVGDLLGSFLKRRLGMKSGAEFFLTDQLLFLVVALAFAWPFHPLALDELVFLVVLTFILHKTSNIVAHRLHLKQVPW